MNSYASKVYTDDLKSDEESTIAKRPYSNSFNGVSLLKTINRGS